MEKISIIWRNGADPGTAGPRPETVSLALSGLAIRVTSAAAPWLWPQSYSTFMMPAATAADQTLTIHSGERPELPAEPPLFRSGANGWSLWADSSGRFLVDVAFSEERAYRRRTAVFSHDFAEAQVYLEADERQNLGAVSLFPLAYPLHQIAFINLLAQGYGAMLHAAAAVVGGRAFVFAGASGAGKSTLAALLAERSGTVVLNDDAVVIRRVGHQYWAYGTPWCGRTPLCSPLGAPIAGIYEISHGPANHALPLSGVAAVTMLMGRVYAPFYRPEALSPILALLDGLAQAAPCYRLSFLPDQRVLDYVLAQS